VYILSGVDSETLGFSSFFDLVTREAKKNVQALILALEFVGKAKDITAIIENNTQVRNGLKIFLLFDAFAFVPLYPAFLFFMGENGSRHRHLCRYHRRVC